MGMSSFAIKPLSTVILAAWSWNTPVFAFEEVVLSNVTVPITFEPGITTGLMTASSDARRFTLGPDGFVLGSGEERVVSHPDADEGVLMQPAGTFLAQPLDDLDAPTDSGDLLHWTKNVAGDAIAYPGEHSEPDIFGTTGKGVVLTQGASGTGVYNAVNLKAAGLVAGDRVRVGLMMAITAGSGGTIGLGFSGGIVASLNFTHDAEGRITSFPDSWSTTRADFYNLPFLINGKRWVFLWVERASPGTSDINVRVQQIDTVAGRKLHVCSATLQVNPLDAPAAIPVTQSGTYTADRVATGIGTQIGFILHGAASVRSITPGGVISAPALEVGVPYLPIVSRIEVLNSIEIADRSGLMPNANLPLFATPWLNPTNFVRYYGPCRLQRNWLIVASFRNCVNATIGSVFTRRKEKRAILGSAVTSATHLTGALTVDDNIFLASGDHTIVKWFEQTDNRSGSACTFALIAGLGVSAKNCLVIGSTPDQTRARYSLQQDRTRSKQVYVGEFAPVSTALGGGIDDSGSRYQYLSRVALGSTAQANTLTVTHNDIMALDMWSDPLILGAGTYPFEMRRCFFGHTANYDDMYLAQSQRQIQVSLDGGTSWENFLDTGLTIQDLPHGAEATYVGSYDPVTDTVAYGSGTNKGPLRIRYFESGSVSSPHINRSGYQWHGSQMDMGSHTRYPSHCDVFRTAEHVGPSGIPMMLEVVYQSGQWRTGNVWTPFIGSAIGNPSLGATGTHPDFLQINRFSITINAATISDNVFIGSGQGMFLTGASGLGEGGSELGNFTISNWLLICNQVNGFNWDHSKTVPALATLGPNVLMVQAEIAKPFTLGDGTAGNLIIRTNGINNVLTVAPGSNVTLVTASGGVGGADAGAVFNSTANVRRIPTAVRSGFTTWTRPAGDDDLQLVQPEWRKANGRIALPETSDDARAFRLADDIVTRVGFDFNALIEAAIGTHPEWDDIAEDLYQTYLGAPAAIAEIPNTAAVGTVLATGLTGQVFAEAYSGNAVDRLYEIVGDELRVARALTGLNRIDVLLTTVTATGATRRYVIDIRPAAAPTISGARILGTPEAGQTLRVRFVARGLPVPSITRQWQKNGTNISGATGETLVLSGGLGLVDADVISCEITATSAAGSATAEPSRTFTAADAPEITASSITGSPFDGEVLTATATVTGTPSPTLTYQWQRNGTSISGATASTLTLNAGSQGWVDGDTISCEITATNGSGSDSAEPTRTYEAAPFTVLAGILSGKANSGVWDLRAATNSGTFTAANLAGTASAFTQATAAAQPALDATNGPSFDGNDQINATIASANYSLYVLVRKDPASGSGRILRDHVVYTDGSALSVFLSGSGLVSVDGSATTTRDALHDALDAAHQFCIVAITGTNVGATLSIGRDLGSGLIGNVMAVVALRESEFTDIAATRAAVVAQLERLF
jgi:hypothetical protein